MKNTQTSKFSKQMACMAATMAITLNIVAAPSAIMAQVIGDKAENIIKQSSEKRVLSQKNHETKVNLKSNAEVIIPDRSLRLAIIKALQIDETDPITAEKMAGLTSLIAISQNITNLEGLEYATNLEQLNLISNSISDITPIQNLRYLKELRLSKNALSDVKSLVNLTQLTVLELGSNKVTDIEAIENMRNLRVLNIGENKLKNISSLENLDSLETLYINSNQLTDISPVENLTDLKYLYAYNNQLTDIALLAKLAQLNTLFLNSNQITNLDVVAQLSSLKDLHISDNQVTDITALGKLPDLENANLSQNQITNITPLSKLKEMYYLDLAQNQISDLSPLKENTFKVFSATNQQITLAPTHLANETYQLTVNNTIKDRNGDIVLPTSITPIGSYNPAINNVTWTGLNEPFGEVQYSFANPFFSGEVKQAYTKGDVATGMVTPANFTLGKSKYIEGTYTGDVAKVTTIVNGTSYSGGTVADGKIKIYVYDKIKSLSDEVMITAHDKEGKLLDTKAVTIEAGTVMPANFKLGTDKYLGGTYTGNIVKVKMTVNDTTYSGGSLTDGIFKVYAYDKIKNANDKVIITAYDKNGEQLDQKPVIVEVLANTVTPDVYTFGISRYVTGSYTGNVSKIELDVAGTIYKGGTLADGKLKFYAHGKIKATSEAILLRAYDKTGKLLDTKPVNLK